jgi:hypothetical protein
MHLQLHESAGALWQSQHQVVNTACAGALDGPSIVYLEHTSGLMQEH